MISLSGSNRFTDIAGVVRAFQWRPEVKVAEIGAPQRLAPYALAFEAEINQSPDDSAFGRLVILYNPAGDNAWQGTTRFVSYTQADVEFEMATDPLLADVAWSWLVDALHHTDAVQRAASGTVTTITSHAFGGLDEVPQSAEIEMRCSWTSAKEGDEAKHVAAWQELLCQLAGLEPLVDGITSLRHHSQGSR